MQLEIDDLQRKLRYIELEQKKREIELNADLSNERQRADELQEILQTKLVQLQENQEVIELQERLACVENDLYEKQQIAHEMLQQLTQMEQENIHLNDELQRVQLDRNSLHNIDGEPAEQEKLLLRCEEIERENRDLSIEVESIRRGAIDAIVEKDRTIYDLQEENDNMQASLREALEIQNSRDTAKGREAGMIEEQLKCEYEQRLRVLASQYEELQYRFDQDALSHEEQLLHVEQSISSRVFESLQQHLDSAKSTESELLAQLQLLEERAKSAEKLLADSQKLLNLTREEARKEREVAESKVQRLLKQCEQFEEVAKVLKLTSKELEELKKTSEKEITDKNNQLEKLTLRRNDSMKLQANLEADNRRLKDTLQLTKQAMNEAQFRTEQLEENLREAAERQIVKLSEKKESELHAETKRTSSSNKKVKSASMRQRGSPSHSLSSSGSERVQTEFNDEDFDYNFDTDEQTKEEQEEEKIDDLTSTAIAVTPKKQSQQQRVSESSNSAKKKMAVVSEIILNPLNANRPSSTRATSKMFSFSSSLNDEGQQQQLQQSEGLLRQRVAKLECIVTSYEVTIEKLQNESKQTLKQLQEARRERVLSNREAQLIDELNSFKTHCNRVEMQFVTQKLQLTEDVHFFKEEVKILEKLHASAREHLASLQIEKDYFQNRYNKLKSILKSRRTVSLGGGSGGSYSQQQLQSVYFQGDPLVEANGLEHYDYSQPQHAAAAYDSPSNSSILQKQQQQKKKTFWIFK